MKLKIILLTALALSNHQISTASSTEDNKPLTASFFGWGAIGITTTFVLAQLLSNNSIAKQAGSVMLNAALSGPISDQMITKVGNAYWLSTMNTRALSALAILAFPIMCISANELVKLPDTGSLSALPGESERKSLDQSLWVYNKSVLLKLSVGAVIGAGASFALNEYVKQYLR